MNTAFPISGSKIATSPELYAEAIAYLYKRQDGKEDPPNFRLGDLKQQEELATKFHDLLERVRRIPVSDEAGISMSKN